MHQALADAVDRRMVADVPVGVLLSGGVDSSLLVALLAERGQRELATFSIGFEGVGEEAGDEFVYSDEIAARFGTEHHRIAVPPDRTLERLGDCVAAMSEPMVSHDCIGFYLLSAEVAAHCKVVQSGQGADEIFAGYHWHPPMMASERPVADYAERVFDRDHAELEATLAPPRRGGADHSRALLEGHFAEVGAERPIDKALRFDTEILLVDDPVKRVDNMTMAWGLEARVPFLDHELVELASRMPAEQKIAGEEGKHVLKEVARELLPASVIDRPKGYFPVPGLKYLRGPYLERARAILHRPAARERGLFDPATVETLLADPEAHLTPLGGSKLWQVALLEEWLQRQGIGSAG